MSDTHNVLYARSALSIPEAADIFITALCALLHARLPLSIPVAIVSADDFTGEILMEMRRDGRARTTMLKNTTQVIDWMSIGRMFNESDQLSAHRALYLQTPRILTSQLNRSNESDDIRALKDWFIASPWGYAPYTRFCEDFGPIRPPQLMAWLKTGLITSYTESVHLFVKHAKQIHNQGPMAPQERAELLAPDSNPRLLLEAFRARWRYSSREFADRFNVDPGRIADVLSGVAVVDPSITRALKKWIGSDQADLQPPQPIEVPPSSTHDQETVVALSEDEARTFFRGHQWMSSTQFCATFGLSAAHFRKWLGGKHSNKMTAAVQAWKETIDP